MEKDFTDFIERRKQEFQKSKEEFGTSPENCEVKLDPYDTGWKIIPQNGNPPVGSVYPNCDNDVEERFSASYGYGLLVPHTANNPLEAATNAYQRWMIWELALQKASADTHFRVVTKDKGVTDTLYKTQSWGDAYKFWKSVQPDCETCESPKFWLECGRKKEDSEIDWEIASKYAPPGVYC